MWNSGSEVISRSCAVSSIQNGKPSPAIAYARWVCMTSLDRPVVPEVGISTATSSGRATSGSPSSPAVSPAAASSPASSRPSGGATPASCTSPASPGSVISARGETWPASPASSAGALRGLTGTVTAPSAARASQHSRYGGVVRAVIMTRSPRRTPAAASVRATPATRCAAASNVISVSSSRSQTRPASRAAAAASSRGIVPE